MSDVLGINPIVFRLCTFDPEALEYVEKKYNMPRQVIIAFIVSLANLPAAIINILTEKDMYRSAYLESEKNKRMRKEAKQKEEKTKNRLVGVLREEGELGYQVYGNESDLDSESDDAGDDSGFGYSREDSESVSED